MLLRAACRSFKGKPYQHHKTPTIAVSTRRYCDFRVVEDDEVEEALLYTRDHLWIRRNSEGLTIGVAYTPGYEPLGIQTFEYTIGAPVKQGQTVAMMISQAQNLSPAELDPLAPCLEDFPINSPVSGNIINFNQSLKLVNRNPGGESLLEPEEGGVDEPNENNWVIKIATDNPLDDTDYFLTRDEYFYHLSLKRKEELSGDPSKRVAVDIWDI